MQQYERRLCALREILRQEQLDGFLVPRADEFQGEYVPAHRQRLGWLTGFTGSAGLAVIGQEWAALFVDGRYVLQAAQQVDGSCYRIFHSGTQPVAEWLAETCRAGQRIGFDPWLHSERQIAALRTACGQVGAELRPVTRNPVDCIWTDRPVPPLAPLLIHPLQQAGQSSDSKRAEIAARLVRDGQDCAVLSDPASVAWVLNVRAEEVPHLPVPLCFALVRADGSVDLFIDGARLSPAVRQHLGPQVRCHAPSALHACLDGLGAAQSRVRVDGGQSPFALGEALRQAGARVDLSTDPSALPRSVKNAVELEGARRAHRRDGVAMVRFLIWFGGQTDLDEVRAARQMDQLRRRDPLCRDLSFATIAGSGPNGAIVHYQAEDSTARTLHPGDLFLLDSGGQYADGTTDVTRTLAFGPPSAQAIRDYTLVLKGHMALSMAVFPVGTSGPQLDSLARQYLWQAGLDYDHGTGHGVGSYLSVHEGPQRISKQGEAAVPLQPGMILSIEPGCYRTGQYGIRLENLVEVEQRPTPPGGDRPCLGFRPLTLVPFDRSLIDLTLLNGAERAWLRDYHQHVQHTLSPDLTAGERDWLASACGHFG